MDRFEPSDRAGMNETLFEFDLVGRTLDGCIDFEGQIDIPMGRVSTRSDLLAVQGDELESRALPSRKAGDTRELAGGEQSWFCCLSRLTIQSGCPSRPNPLLRAGVPEPSPRRRID